jgi:hypothetical protein
MEAIHRQILTRAASLSRSQTVRILHVIREAQLEHCTGPVGEEDTFIELSSLTPQVLGEILRIISS